MLLKSLLDEPNPFVLDLWRGLRVPLHRVNKLKGRQLVALQARPECGASPGCLECLLKGQDRLPVDGDQAGKVDDRCGKTGWGSCVDSQALDGIALLDDVWLNLLDEVAQ